VRTIQSTRVYSHDKNGTLVDRALAAYEAMTVLREYQVSSYTEPVRVPYEPNLVRRQIGKQRSLRTSAVVPRAERKWLDPRAGAKGLYSLSYEAIYSRGCSIIGYRSGPYSTYAYGKLRQAPDQTTECVSMSTRRQSGQIPDPVSTETGVIQTRLLASFERAQ